MRRLFARTRPALLPPPSLSTHTPPPYTQSRTRLGAQAALHGVHTPSGSVCLQEFRDALNAVVLGREQGAEPAWFTEGLAALLAGAEGQ